MQNVELTMDYQQKYTTHQQASASCATAPPYSPVQHEVGQQQQQTVVVVQQPASTLNFSGQPQNIRDWSTGLCDCFDDCFMCFVAFFCPPCYMCWLAGDMGENMCAAFCCSQLFAPPMRTKVRAMHGIRGDIWSDISIMSCCGPCALTQTHREINYCRVPRA